VQEAAFEGISDFELERESLFDVITECRVVRDALDAASGQVLPQSRSYHEEAWA
jgi:hypothetical protein